MKVLVVCEDLRCGGEALSAVHEIDLQRADSQRKRCCWVSAAASCVFWPKLQFQPDLRTESDKFKWIRKIGSCRFLMWKWDYLCRTCVFSVVVGEPFGQKC